MFSSKSASKLLRRAARSAGFRGAFVWSPVGQHGARICKKSGRSCIVVRDIRG